MLFCLAICFASPFAILSRLHGVFWFVELESLGTRSLLLNVRFYFSLARVLFVLFDL